MAVFCSSRLHAFFLSIITGIDNTERVASDFSNEYPLCRNYQIPRHYEKSIIHEIKTLQS